MGACSVEARFNGRLTIKDLKEKYQQMREKIYADRGNDPYNGTWTTIPDLHVDEQTFEDPRAASQFCLRKAQKWLFAVAAKVEGELDTEGDVKPAYWLVAGWAAEQE